jgi:hypothetical protein
MRPGDRSEAGIDVAPNSSKCAFAADVNPHRAAREDKQED